MNSKSILVLVAIISTISIIVSVSIASNASANPETDRCISSKGLPSEGSPFLSSLCADKSVEGYKDIIKAERELCQSGDVKCNGSQTGNGELGNWYKKGEIDLP
jgi:hypothetical protein